MSQCRYRYDVCIPLLRMAVSRAYSAEVEARMWEAADSIEGGRAALEHSVSQGDGWRLRAMAELTHSGALQPWPPLIVQLVTTSGCACMPAICAAFAAPLVDRNRFAVGASVFAFDAEANRWHGICYATICYDVLCSAMR
jgi:hypothetical protein